MHAYILRACVCWNELLHLNKTLPLTLKRTQSIISLHFTERLLLDDFWFILCWGKCLSNIMEEKSAICSQCSSSSSSPSIFIFPFPAPNIIIIIYLRSVDAVCWCCKSVISLQTHIYNLISKRFLAVYVCWIPHQPPHFKHFLLAIFEFTISPITFLMWIQ